jgi:FkbM family methyltransferase
MSTDDGAAATVVLERLKWLLIRRWPAGYRLASRLERHLRRPAYYADIDRARRLFAAFVRPGSLCFDVGANHGARTEVFLGLGARVVAVEPQPRCLARLRARFGPSRDFALVAAAVGDAEGRATLYLGRNDLISTLSPEWLDEARTIPELAAIGWEGEIDVPVTTLDRLIDAHGTPDFCKIDVEGFELEVLRGLSRPLPLVSLEYTRWRLEPMLACIDRLAALGDYRFNLSEHETMRLAFATEWLDAAQVSAVLGERYRDHAFGYGDVYARLEAPKNALKGR